MASSKCKNCGFEYFETVVNRPHNADTEITFVQCVSCGYVVGMFQKHDHDELTKLIVENFTRVEQYFMTIDHNIRLIAVKLGLKDTPPKHHE